METEINGAQSQRMKIIEKINTGERFIEASVDMGEAWRDVLKLWNHSLNDGEPCPLPIGHHAFIYPELYGCRIVEK